MNARGSFCALSLVVVSACAAPAERPGPGCAKVGAVACQGAVPTYAGEVRAVLARRCFSCHEKDGIAAEDHDFGQYGVARAQHLAIAGMAKACSMPPKPAAPLERDELATLVTWAECGAPP